MNVVTPRAKEGVPLHPMESTIPPPQINGVSGTDSPAPGMESSYLDYDPEVEVDSDLGEGEGQVGDMWFSADQNEPSPADVPKFTGSFIFKPGRAQKDEARWLRVIRESGGEIWASKFDL